MELVLRILVTAELAVMVARSAALAVHVGRKVRASRQPGRMRRACISYALFALSFLFAVLVYGPLLKSTVATAVLLVVLTANIRWPIRTLLRLARGEELRPVRRGSLPDILARSALVAPGLVLSCYTFAQAVEGRTGPWFWEIILILGPIGAAIVVQRPLRGLGMEQAIRVMAGLDPDGGSSPPPPRRRWRTRAPAAAVAMGAGGALIALGSLAPWAYSDAPPQVMQQAAGHGAAWPVGGVWGVGLGAAILALAAFTYRGRAAAAAVALVPAIVQVVGSPSDLALMTHRIHAAMGTTAATSDFGIGGIAAMLGGVLALFGALVAVVRSRRTNAPAVLLPPPFRRREP